MPTVRGFLKQIQSFLNDSEKKIFEEAWAHHALDIGLALEEKDQAAMSRFVDWRAKDILQKRFQANDGKGSGIYNPNTKCYSEKYGIEMSCILTCELLPVSMP